MNRFPSLRFVATLRTNATSSLAPACSLARSKLTGRALRTNTFPLQRRKANPFSIPSRTMSFSNTDTGSKPADPYKETNISQPDLKEKVEDLIRFMEACKFGMMTTRVESSGLLTSRCMALAAKEGNGIDLIFHTNTESGKTDDLKSDPKINIAFLNSTGEWASISGEADIITDREMVRKYYSPALKAWLGDLEDGKHDGGPEDPRIGCIKVTAKTATYAIASGTMIGRALEVGKGAVTGQAPKVNKLREISEEELKQWR